MESNSGKYKFATDQNLSASKIDKAVPYPLLKRIFDLTISLFALIILSPLFLLIFLATKIEGWLNPACRGPFIYSETRISAGQPFKFYKIRIFKPKVLSETLENEGFIHTKPLEADKRNLTTVGNFLKKFYLDEIAQFINVIKGEMSLVGTRPWNVVDYKREVGMGIYRKKVIKAGITGLLQITKGTHYLYPGGDKGLDDYYIDFCRTHSSIQIVFFDLKIIGWSIIKLLRGQG